MVKIKKVRDINSIADLAKELCLLRFKTTEPNPMSTSFVSWKKMSFVTRYSQSVIMKLCKY